jgi:cytochrome c biogenesis protein CcdA
MRHCAISFFFAIATLWILSVASASDSSANPSPNVANNTLSGLSLSSTIAVFIAGALAGFNPCLLAMLAFLASTMLASSNRRRDILIMVAFFSLGTFAIYIILGLGLFSFLQERSTVAMFRFFLAAILIILGLKQLEDARRLQSGGHSLFRVDWTKKYVQGVISSRKLSSYFLLGVLFSLVRAPCVGGMLLPSSGQFLARDLLLRDSFTC